MAEYIADLLLISAKCKRFFTRVVEPDDDELFSQFPVQPREPVISSDRKRYLYGTTEASGRLKSRTMARISCCLSGSDSGSGSDIDSDDGDMQGFVRVHLMSRRRRPVAKISNQANPGEYFKLEQTNETKRPLAHSCKMSDTASIMDRLLQRKIECDAIASQHDLFRRKPSERSRL